VLVNFIAIEMSRPYGMNKKKKLKTKAELEAEVAVQQLQSKRFHEKVKESVKVYKRQETKRKAEEEIESE
jgi:hypothetical protein